MITDEEEKSVTEDTELQPEAITEETVAEVDAAPKPDRPVQGAQLEHIAGVQDILDKGEDEAKTIEDKILVGISNWVNEHVYNSGLARVSTYYNELTAKLPKLVDFIKKEISDHE